MTDDELRALLDAATPGPWAVVLDKNSWGWVDVKGPSFRVHGPTMATDLTAKDKTKRIADARLIAAAPDLAAEVLRLRAKVAAGDKLAEITQQAARDARDVFSEYRTAREAIDYMEQLIYAARQERNAAEDQERELAEELRTVKAERDALAARVKELGEETQWQNQQRADAMLRRHLNAPEDPHVATLCERYGYGAVMDAASRLWARKDSIGAFYIGGCIGMKSDDDARAALTQETKT